MEILIKKITEKNILNLNVLNFRLVKIYTTNRRQIVKSATSRNNFLRQLKVIGLPKNNEIFLNEGLLKVKQTLQNLADEMGVNFANEDCFRLGKIYSTNQQPILVTFPSLWDNKTLLNKALEYNLQRRKKILVVLELSLFEKKMRSSC